MRATRLIHMAAGIPAPHEGDGTPVPPRPHPPTQRCAMCGEMGAFWRYDDALSNNFWPIKNLSQLFPFDDETTRVKVGAGTQMTLCAACVYCARAWALRCAPFVATESGAFFFQRREDLLAALLDPPEPPFVFGWPAYGMDHGGPNNLHRCVWLGHTPEDPLLKLQAKHTAIYCETSLSRERFGLQIDDALHVTVDRSEWASHVERLTACAVLLRGASMGFTETREALTTLRAPKRAPIAVHARWPALVRDLKPFACAAWWPHLVELLPLPEMTPRAPKPVAEKTPKNAPKPPKPPKPAPSPNLAQPPTLPQPTAPKDAHSHEARPQLSLF